MKKVFLTLAFIALTIIGFSQSVFKPIPKDLFRVANKTALKTALKLDTAVVAPTKILWRFNATLVGTELLYNKTTKQFVSRPLSGIGPGFGVRHYYSDANGLPATDWGISLVILVGTDIENIEVVKIKPAITVNAFNFINLGVDTDFKTIGIVLGAQVNF
jgi:hypothetical protein